MEDVTAYLRGFFHNSYVNTTYEYVQETLHSLGVSEEYQPDKEELFSSLLIAIVSLLVYYLFFGRRNKRYRDYLRKQLEESRRKVEELEDQLLEVSLNEKPVKPSREIRIWMDGAFDLMHYGHMNAFRQARSLGTYLVVGVNSSESITACKGPPVMTDDERIEAVRGCKFVDVVEENCPYVMNEDYLRYVIEKHKIDYVVHGDDSVIVDGKDCYAVAKQMGKYRSFPRTEGVSTTEIVGRMLLMTKEHHTKSLSEGSELVSRASPYKKTLSKSSSAVGATSASASSSSSPPLSSPATSGATAEDTANDGSGKGKEGQSPPAKAGAGQGAALTGPLSNGLNGVLSDFHRSSQFLTTNRMLRLFSVGFKEPPPNAAIVYIDGSWDMFHAGHVRILREAKSRGDYLIVGIHNDALVNSYYGSNFPIMNMNERVLSVLGCKHVDDVLLDAPFAVTREMVASLSLSKIIHAKETAYEVDMGRAVDERFEIPIRMNIFEALDIEQKLTVTDIIRRIQENRERFHSKIEKKAAMEQEYYDERYKDVPRV